MEIVKSFILLAILSYCRTHGQGTYDILIFDIQAANACTYNVERYRGTHRGKGLSYMARW